MKPSMLPVMYRPRRPQPTGDPTIIYPSTACCVTDICGQPVITQSYQPVVTECDDRLADASPSCLTNK